MPELPEVETIKNCLANSIAGKTITKTEVRLDKYYSTMQPELLSGLTVEKLSRRGKFLLLHLSRQQCLIFHMRMTGKLLYCQAEELQHDSSLLLAEDSAVLSEKEALPEKSDDREALNGKITEDKHTQLIISFEDQSLLVFNDIRKFGMVWLVAENQLTEFEPLKKLGCEPLSDSFTEQYLAKCLSKRKNKIKALLLDQSLIAGIGNIYADEALYYAGINPQNCGCDLNHEQISKLWQAIRYVIAEGIKNGGTTIKDYVDGSGAKGSFQNYLAVYGRTGQTCRHCEQKIERIKIAGRSTHFCPNCQR